MNEINTTLDVLSEAGEFELNNNIEQIVISIKTKDDEIIVLNNSDKLIDILGLLEYSKYALREESE